MQIESSLSINALAFKNYRKYSILNSVRDRSLPQWEPSTYGRLQLKLLDRDYLESYNWVFTFIYRITHSNETDLVQKQSFKNNIWLPSIQFKQKRAFFKKPVVFRSL